MKPIHQEVSNIIFNFYTSLRHVPDSIEHTLIYVRIEEFTWDTVDDSILTINNPSKSYP